MVNKRLTVTAVVYLLSGGKIAVFLSVVFHIDNAGKVYLEIKHFPL